ncbi:MAG TPA: hypothetical protein VEA59_05070 [Patescibacteria group bacterium]|nr:hypothetical protein [Patescibacteria group bacterium]
MTKKIIAGILLGLLIVPEFAHAQLPVDPAFNPNKIIEDTAFTNTKSFSGPEAIQKFLESKNSVLANTSTDFVMKLREPGFVDLKQIVEDPNAIKGSPRTAAELIWDAARSTGINPQVLLVTLQKEQSLITGHQNSSPERLQRALDNAMGFDCPDSTGCGDILPGFYFQLFGSIDAEGNRYLGAARSLMKSFNTPGGRGPSVQGSPAKVGQHVTLGNTVGDYTTVAQQTVTMGNLATAALYRYTPHVFNGNYNFWKYFTTWFKLQDGTIVTVASDANTYIIQNGARLTITPFVARLKGINTASAQSFAMSELENYPAKGVLPLDDNTVVRADGKYYVFISGKKYQASEFTISQRGLSASSAIEAQLVDISPFTDSGVLTPADGTVVKGDKGSDVFLVKKGVLNRFSQLTFKQYKADKQVQTLPQAEVDSYPKGGYVPPVSGTLIKSEGGKFVYLVDQETKRPVVDGVFKDRGFKQVNVVTLASEEFNSVSTAAAATPKENAVVKTDKSKSIYFFKNGQKHPVSAWVLKQRGMWVDYTVPEQVANEWYTGLALLPKNGTVVKGNKSATVYIVESGKLRAISTAELKKKKLTKKIQVLPQAEVNSYVKAN